LFFTVEEKSLQRRDFFGHLDYFIPNLLTVGLNWLFLGFFSVGEAHFVFLAFDANGLQSGWNVPQ
jgi:hypothetical protein